ncbi:MAG: cellulase family glycosylhydrolase [Chitinophagaceae bacterium]
MNTILKTPAHPADVIPIHPGEPFLKIKSFRKARYFFLCLLFLFINGAIVNAQMTVVQKYGQLRVQGNRIVDKNGSAIQLRGMSLYWSQWIPKYYTFNTIKWLRDDWKITVIRAAMGINGSTDGYLVNPTAEKNKVIAVVDAAIQLGIYVIIDWHDHNAHNSRSQAQAFFAEMAQRYANSPNVLYELWNEPLNYSWTGVIKPYHQAVIGSIRQHDPDNIIICGTRNWSQEVDEAATSPISGSNIAYTLHYYANTHGSGLRSKASTALSRGVALFVTEYGTTDASGNGTVNATASREWWNFLDQNGISHANWSVADIGESSAALNSGASPNGGWTISQIKQSGQLVRGELIAKAPDLTDNPPATSIQNGTYRITARNSGKSFDVQDRSTADGANILQWTYGGGTNQQWNVLSLGSGAYSIRAVHSGKSLDLSGWSTADGGDINQWTYSGGNNQRWRIESVGSGYFRIVSVHSGKAVEITGNSSADGAAINQRTYSGATNQQFTFQLLGSAARSSSEIMVQETPGESVMKNLVYPNPSSGLFTIKLAGEFTYVVRDLNGKTVIKGKGMNTTAFGNELTRGIYILQVKTINESTEIKLVKN